MMNNFFKSALPVWIEGRDKEWNVHARLTYAAKDLYGAKMTLTGASFYQIFVGNKLIHFGPARKGIGQTAVDVVPLPDVSDDTISIIVAGYYCRSFNGIRLPSFIQAEIESESGEILAATGKEGFEGYEYSARLQKVMRYSYQRQFAESYDLARPDKAAKFVLADPELTYVKRGVDLLDLDEKQAKFVKVGTYTMRETEGFPMRRFEIAPPNPSYDQYAPEEVDTAPFREYLKMDADYETKVVRGSAKTLEHWDFGKIETGFLSLHATVKRDCRIIAVFGEQNHPDGRPYPHPSDATNCVEWILPAGEYDLTAFEPYVIMGVEIMITEGEVDIDYVGIIECAFSSRKIKPYTVKDPELAKVYRAAIDTFRHNAVDIYMDCPSRERAGWLCDSYYTSQTEFALTGDTMVENEFLNNYLVGGSAKAGLNGMVDMCYPAITDTFIPQWSLWYVLELYDYFTKRGHGDRRDDFKGQLYDLLAYFKNFENEYGLLERLQGWNFVEWSALNRRIHDVSWPTNMLFYEALRIIGTIYEDEAIIEKAAKLRETIRKMAWNGKVFLDRAMRQEDGTLKNADELSETTQYYALRFGIADIDEPMCAEMKDLVMNVFGKDIMAEKCPEFEPSNALPGFYIRSELLLKWKMYPELSEYVKHFFLPMAEKTGTLWEHKHNAASCDHGFASFVAVVIQEIQENS